MSTIIITVPASGFSSDTIGLAMHLSKLKEPPSVSFFLKTIEQKIKINLN